MKDCVMIDGRNFNDQLMKIKSYENIKKIATIQGD